MIDYAHWHLDRSLLFALLALSAIGLVTLYSASGASLEVVLRHGLRLAAGFALLVIIAQARPETLARWSPYVFALGLILLATVLLAGTTSKGAQRWLNLGITRIQPSEFMKLCLPMMLAWYFARGSLPPRLHRFGLAVVILLVPTALIAAS